MGLIEEVQQLIGAPDSEPFEYKPSHVGGLLRVARRDAGVKLRVMADELGQKPSYVSSMERGLLPVPGDAELARWAAFLGADPAHIITAAQLHRLQTATLDELHAHARELTRQLHEARQEAQHWRHEAKVMERQLELERTRGGRRGGR